MANELIYQSIFQGAQMDERLTAVASLQEALAAVEQAITAKYTKPVDGIPETDLDAAVQSALAKARSAVQDLSSYYTKTEIDALLSAVNSQQYVDVTALPTASADTLGKIYLVGPDANNQYARYYTSYDGSAYSWVAAGTTEINLALYATKAELSQLSQDVRDGIHLQTFAYSKLTSQQPNISLGQDTQLYLPGDFVEIKANSNGAAGVLLRRATSYNQPCVKYTASNTLAIRMTSSANNFIFQDASVDAQSVQTIKILLVSVSADFKNWGVEYYLDGTKIGEQIITTSGSTQYLPFVGQIGYNSVADIYHVKIKSNGTETEFVKLGEIQGAVGVTDIYTYTDYDGLVGLDTRLNVVEQNVAEIDEIVENFVGEDMYFRFHKTSTHYNVQSHFSIYQRIKGDYYVCTDIGYYVYNGSAGYPNGYWRVERTDIGRLIDGVWTSIQSQVITAGENEFVLQWLAGSGYNFSAGFSGGFHYGETIDNVVGAWVEFVADGNRLSTDADIPLTPCKSFYYREYSPIYQHNDDTIAAWHLKETAFKDGGYETINDVKFVQALDYFAYPGIVCVSRWLSEKAMPEGVATITNMGDGSTTIAEQFKSNGHRIHYEGNGYICDVESEVLIGADDAQCQRVVYNSSAYNKFYRRNPDTEGSLNNRLKGRTKVKIYAM